LSLPPDIQACPGCGLEAPELEAPTPALLGASPACWAIYGRLLVREYSAPIDDVVRRLTVATYAAQHPDTSQPRSSGSTAVHLIALCLMLERGASAQQTTALPPTMLERAQALHWLEPSTPNGTINVADVLSARTPTEHAQLVGRWATNVWSAWAAQHAQVRRWIDANLPLLLGSES
jgi:hypothetical protein